MCTNSCVAYTGPYVDLTTCPRCDQPRFFLNTTHPQKRFSTIPIGPVIQSLYQSPDMASHMHYLEKAIAHNVEYSNTHQGRLGVYNDTSCGKDLMDA